MLKHGPDAVEDRRRDLAEHLELVVHDDAALGLPGRELVRQAERAFKPDRGRRWAAPVEHECKVEIRLVERGLRRAADELPQASERAAAAGGVVVGRARDELRKLDFVAGRPRAVDVDAPAAGLADPAKQLVDDARLAGLPWAADDH